MRYPPEHKAEVHQKIVRDASRRVRSEGLNGAAVAAVMHDTGLTHGGFYNHFDSRDELVTEALDLALTQSGQVMRERLFDGDKPDIPGFVDFYLDESHRTGRAGGCAWLIPGRGGTVDRADRRDRRWGGAGDPGYPGLLGVDGVRRRPPPSSPRVNERPAPHR